jgi:ABC-type multidrug transport system permease subunit
LEHGGIRELPLEEEVHMYLTDIIWWGYTAFVVALALFMLFFAYKVRGKGD